MSEGLEGYGDPPGLVFLPTAPMCLPASQSGTLKPNVPDSLAATVLETRHRVWSWEGRRETKEWWDGQRGEGGWEVQACSCGMNKSWVEKGTEQGR